MPSGRLFENRQAHMPGCCYLEDGGSSILIILLTVDILEISCYDSTVRLAFFAHQHLVSSSDYRR